MKWGTGMRTKACRRLAAACALAGAAPTLRAANLYWDTNGSTAGASGGTTATGNWDGVTSNWTSDLSGASATGTWSNGSVAVFAAGANATGSYSVTVSGTQTLGTASPDAAIIFEEGNVTLDGGTLNMVTGLMTVGTNLTATINSTLDGSAGPGTTVFGKDGAGALVLGGTNTFTGRIDLFAGVIAISSDANLGNSSNDFRFLGNAALDTSASFTTARNIDLLADGMLIQDPATNLTMSGLITGTGSLTKTGAGTLTLTNANEYSGGTTIIAGTLVCDTGINRLPQGGSVTVAGGTLDLGIWDLTNVSTLTLSSGAITSSVGVISAASMDFRSGSASARLAAGGTLTKSTTGTVTLSGANTYTGGTVLNDGTLVISADNNIGDSSGTVTFAGGTLNTTATISTARAVTLNGTGGTFLTNTGTSHTAAGVISGTGALTKTGAGTLRLSANNSYTGRTNINGGTLTLGINGALSASTAVTVSGGATLNLGGFTDTIGSLSGAGPVQLGSGVLTVGADNTSTTYSGLMSGAGGLAKTGSGTLTLSGANSYLGGTAFVGGVVSVPAATVARAPYTFDGGTLRSTATSGFTTGAATTLNSNGGTIDLATGAAVTFSGVLDGPGRLTKTGIGTLVLSNTNSYAGGTTISGGTLQVSADNNLGTGGNLTLSNAILSTTAAFSTPRNVTFNNGGGAVVVTASNLTFAGTVGGNGGLTKSGAGTLVINSVQNWTAGVSSLTVNAGAAVLNTNAGGSGRALNVNASAGAVTFNASQALDQLSVGSGQTVTLSANGSRFIDTPVLTIAGGSNDWNGKVDLVDNDMIVNYVGGSPMPQMINQLKTALNLTGGGYWNGNGITSSAAASDPTHLRGLGIVEASEAGYAGGTFDGRTVDATTVLVKYTYFGDANLDGKINVDDLARFDFNIGLGTQGWYNGDFNYDGVIDRDNDFAILVDSFYDQGTPLTPEAQAIIDHINSVPEPGAAAMVSGSAAAVTMARRRRQHGVSGRQT